MRASKGISRMKWILCLFGFHDWRKFWKDIKVELDPEFCQRCKKWR